MLIGRPIPYLIRSAKRSDGSQFNIHVPDYSHPGVKERIAAEVDEIEDACYDKRKL